MDYNVRNLLYATDLGPHGQEVFYHAAGLALRLGANIHIVHVVEPMSEYAHSLIDNYVAPELQETLRKEGYEEARNEIKRRLDKFCQEQLQGEAVTQIVSTKVIEGLPVEVILGEAKRIGADLIVLGSHGQTALGEIFMGSVAHKVTLKAKLPVLLIPIAKK